MRVLYVNHTSRVSGGELSLLTLLAGAPERLEAAVACPEGDLSRRVRELGIEVFPIRGTDGSLKLHPTGTPRAVLEMAFAAAQVGRAASGFGADLIHANSIRAGIVAVGAINSGGRPTVVHVRDCLPQGRMSALALRAVARADLLIANSAYTRSTLGPSAAQTEVIHNAVDLARFDAVRLTPAEARTRLGLGDGPVLTVVAQITPWKGQDDAIRIAHELLDRHPDLNLLLAGSPKFDSAATRYDNVAFLESLHTLTEDLGITDSVRFLGDRDDVPEIIRAADLLLAPSWEEPFGRTIIEAMAAGVPVAATEVGGPPEILEGAGCGVLLPPRRPQAWSSAIDGLLKDRERMAAMGRAGREVVRERYRPSRHAAEIVRAYETVLSRAPA